jgi:hypothetical protein
MGSNSRQGIFVVFFIIARNSADRCTSSVCEAVAFCYVLNPDNYSVIELTEGNVQE